MNVKQWIKDCLTEDDGNAVCVAKVLAALSFFSFLGYAIYGIHAGHFALTEFAGGLMEVLIGAGSIIAGKQFTQSK